MKMQISSYCNNSQLREVSNNMRIKRTGAKPAGRVITAGSNIASAAKRDTNKKQPITAATKAMRSLTPEMQRFTKQLQRNMRGRQNVMAATNTSNIAARPDFIELLPLFTQNLLVPEVFGTIAMKSRQQLVPYLKVKAENRKGITQAGDVISTPFSNRQGLDPDFTGRVVRDEALADTDGDATNGIMAVLDYNPVLPYSVSVRTATGEIITDDGAGKIGDNMKIDYANGTVTGTIPEGATITYQYDNETIGPREDNRYGALMGKIELQLDEINLVAEAHQLACYQSVYAAFAAQQEYGVNIADASKEAAFGEIASEINTQAFDMVARIAKNNPAFDWDASPVFGGAVVPSDYLNMFKFKLEQAAGSIFQATRLSQPNKLIVGTAVKSVLSMVNTFEAADTSNVVGPHKAGKLGQFDVYVNPNYDPNLWVMLCKSDDIQRNSCLYGEYMPLMQTDPITRADMTVETGFASMYDLEVVNPATVVSGRILGSF